MEPVSIIKEVEGIKISVEEYAELKWKAGFADGMLQMSEILNK